LIRTDVSVGISAGSGIDITPRRDLIKMIRKNERIYRCHRPASHEDNTRRMFKLLLLIVPLLIFTADSHTNAALPAAAPFLKHALDAPDSWYKSDTGRQFCDHLVSWQNANGGWWKKYDPRIPRPAQLPPPVTNDAPPGDTEVVWRRTSTFDNDATCTEMHILARAYTLTHDPKYKTSFQRGLNFIFESQYPLGGWPQRFPLEKNYGRDITYNDNAMVNIMTLLRDIADAREDVTFIDSATREKCRSAFERGVACTLKLQIKTNGHLTAWAQQYDPKTLQPATARAYELPGISASESDDIVLMLMDLPHPDSQVQTAIESAVQWYRDSEITGKKFKVVTGPQYENGKDKLLVDDPSAPAIWARFYDLSSNRPFFCARDGIKRWKVSEISWERRNFYAWYGTWGSRVLEAYPKWKERVKDEK
jgi:pectinesterase